MGKQKQKMEYSSDEALKDSLGRRKYVNEVERNRFYEVAITSELKIKLFCKLLYETGARISEILNLKVMNIDFSNQAITIRSLKKRRKVVYRDIPLPPSLLKEIQHFIQTSVEHGDDPNASLWDFSRRTATRYVAKIMQEANVSGPQACSRGLRHSFAVHCLFHNVPLTLIQSWMGHASISTTKIYLNVVGKEARKFAERMWDHEPHTDGFTPCKECRQYFLQLLTSK